MLIQDLVEKQLIKPPTWLPSNTCFLTTMGSVAYGVSTDNSDLDLYGVTIPPKQYTMPSGVINGFDKLETFNQFQDHHVLDKSARGGKGQNYDIKIYGIVNFFHLLCKNDTGVIDALFVPRECIKHSTRMWEVVRDNRKLFLHKGIYHRSKGYAFSQLQKAKNCTKYLIDIREFEEEFNIPHTTTFDDVTKNRIGVNLNPQQLSEYVRLWNEGLNKTKRFESQKIHNCDVKFLYHVFRLIDQAEYILTNHDLDLQEKSRREIMKAIRRGDLSHDEVVQLFKEKEKVLDRLYETSTLRHGPAVDEIRTLLLSSLEDHYGSIDKAFKTDDRYERALLDIKKVYERYGI